MKICIGCNEELDIMRFYNLNDNDDLFQSACITCRAAGIVHSQPMENYDGND